MVFHLDNNADCVFKKNMDFRLHSTSLIKIEFKAVFTTLTLREKLSKKLPENNKNLF